MADESTRQRIELACPECGNVQIEPALVISTHCRACRAHFQVRDGKGVPRTIQTARFASPCLDSDSESSVLPPLTSPKLTLRRGPSPPAPRSLLMRILNPTKPHRTISCFNCAHSFETSGDAQSTQCPKCSGYVSLLNYEIHERWNRFVETCGNVVIQKSGAVSGATLRCHHLTIFGTFSGTAECSGDLIIRSSGKIIGDIRCQTLRVEKKSRVEFLHPVIATSASIDGNVRGQISCTGTVTLEKRAHLQGLVRTSSLIVKSGAKHTGSIEMINPSE